MGSWLLRFQLTHFSFRPNWKCKWTKFVRCVYAVWNEDVDLWRRIHSAALRFVAWCALKSFFFASVLFLNFHTTYEHIMCLLFFFIFLRFISMRMAIFHTSAKCPKPQNKNKTTTTTAPPSTAQGMSTMNFECDALKKIFEHVRATHVHTRTQ